MITSLLLLSALAMTVQDPITAAQESFRKVASYRVTLQSKHDGSKDIIRYFFRKPGFVRMEFISPHNGAVLVYEPMEKKVRLRPFGFGKLFILTLSPDNDLVKSPQGHRVDASDIGEFLRQVKTLQEHGITTVLGEDMVGGKSTLLVRVEGSGTFQLEGVHHYLLWLDKATMLPLRTAGYGRDGELIEDVLMDDLELDVSLDDNLFRL